MSTPATKNPKEETKEVTDRALLTNLLQTLNNVVTGVVASNQQMFRAFVMLSLLMLLAIGLLEYFRRWWKDDFELRFPVAGTAIILHSSPNANDFKSAVFLVPASKCWINTGLEINHGDHVTIRASGHVHLAMKQIEQEKIPSIFWSEPDGSPFVKLDNIDRSGLLINKSYYDDNHNHELRIGNLVGYFLPVGKAKNVNDFPSADNPHPSKYGGVFHIGRGPENVLNDTHNTVNLWLCVNELVLEDSPEAEKAYLGDHDVFIRNAVKQAKMDDSTDLSELPATKLKAEKSWINRRSEWAKIKNNKAWDLYYYDNIGHYLVTIEKQ